MIRRKSILGVLCLSALSLCAFGASNASATTLHECLKAAGTTDEFTDGTCSTKGAGGFHTVPVVTSPTPASLKPTETSSSTLSTTVGGIKFKITCEKLSGSGTATNEEVGGEMVVHGEEAKFIFSVCKVEEPLNQGCKTQDPIVTEPATSLTKDEAGGVMKNTFTPENEAKKFVTINVSGCEGGFAALNGAKDVTGTATGLTTSANPTSTTFNATSGSSLKFGGQAATFTTTAHSATVSNGQTVALETP